jgi:prevent-host-death family protein
MERIGVRELRQHASRYLARVRAGETIEVTDRGHTVARLVPVREDSWDDLVSAGAVVPPDDAASDLLSVRPRRPARGQTSPSVAVDEGREERL